MATLAPWLHARGPQGGAPRRRPLAGSRRTPLSRAEQLTRILRALQSGSPDVEASALISEDGLMIASALPQHVDESRVAGMSATISSLGTRASVELERGEVEEVLVRGKDGYAVLVAAGSGVLLLVLANKQARLGLVFLDMRRAAAEIRKVLWTAP